MNSRYWLLAGALMLVPAAWSAPLYGDVNGNGVIDFKDAVVLLRVAGGLRPDTDSVRRTGDVAPLRDYNGGSFGDGKIDILDALRVFRKAGGLSTAEWPAKFTAFVLEQDNTFVLRKYGVNGAAVTGPDQDVPDVAETISGPITDLVGGTAVPGVYVIKPVNGIEEHMLQVLDGTNTPASLQATQLVFGGNATTFNPPLIVAQYPFQDGVTWFGQTTVTDVVSGLQFPATYAGTVQGPVVVTTADQTHAFDNAWRVTITYSTAFPGPSGTEYYWFVPFLGPVQHGYSRTIFLQTTTINPDYKLVNANIHGVLYP
ncbi:MAG TPA: dockerin type I repeat-containing protein [Armatimonadota bacterium]|jgi:hypothetical protein